MKKLLILSALSLAFFGCSDDDRLLTDDLTGSKIVGFENTTENVAYFTDEGQITRNLPVKIYGLGDGNTNGSNITITYEVDAANTTAVEGGEYDFASASNQVVIPAGGSFALIPLLVNTGQLNPTQKTELVLKLTATSEGIIGEQVKTVVITFVGCQSEFPTGAYSFTSTAGYSGTVNIVETDINTFSMPFPGVTSGGSAIPMYFSDVCGEFTYLGWEFNDSYLSTSSNVTWDDALQTLTFEELKVYNSTSVSSGVFFDRKTTVYTKL